MHLVFFSLSYGIFWTRYENSLLNLKHLSKQTDLVNQGEGVTTDTETIGWNLA